MSASSQESGVAATLAALRSTLAWFALAVGGRPVTLRDARDGVERATHDAASLRAIRLPATIDDHATRRANVGAYRIAVLRQALSSVDTTWPRSPLWLRVYRTLEQLRVDAVIDRAYPGARTDLARVRARALAARATPRAPLSRVLDALQRHALGAPLDVPRSAADHRAIDALIAHTVALQREGASCDDSARGADAIIEWLGVRPRRARTVATRSDADGLARGADVPSGPAAALRTADGGADAQADATATPTPADATPPARGGVLTRRGMPRGRSRPLATPEVPQNEAAASLTHAAVLARDADEHNGRRFAVDEWHWREQRLLPGWCTLIERPLRGDDATFIRRARGRHPALARAVHRRFAAWRPEGLQRVHGADDGDEIEIERVIEAAVERRAGLVHDRPLYVRRDRALRDVATAFLVDTSASTDFVLRAARAAAAQAAAPSPEADTAFLHDLSALAPIAQTPQRRVIDVAKDALALMCDALHALGDAFAVYTFSGHGRGHVDFRVVKDFHERVSPRTAGALAAMQPHGATRTGAAVRHASAMLARQPQRRRALIVVTDGYPEDIDYGPEPRELRYGLEDTAHALREAQAQRIDTFCLSIDPAGHDYLRRMCPPQRYMVISDVAALPDELSKVYLAMTHAAA